MTPATMDSPYPCPPVGQISPDRHYLAHEFNYWTSMFSVIQSWTVENIRAAINQHDAGYFTASSSLAVVATRYPTIYGPLEQRLGIPLGIARAVKGGDAGAALRAKVQFEEYMRGMEAEFEDVFLPKAMLGFSWLHTHYVERHGDLVPVTKVWPSVATQFLEPWGIWQAWTTEGWVTITDGDGKWTKVGSGQRPHRLCAIRALGEQWAKAGFADRDEAGLSAFLGRMVPYAILPEAAKDTGRAAIVPNSPVGLTVGDTVKTLGKARGGGVFPAGTKVESMSGIDAGSAALFDQIFARTGKNHAYALLGTDGTMSPGAGGVYVSPIFGRVALTVVRRDLSDGMRAFDQIARVTTTLNYSDAVEAPRYVWLLPDPSEAERRAALAAQHKAVNDTVQGWRAAGFDVTDADVEQLEEAMGVHAPKLAPAGKRPEVYAYHLSEHVVAPDESRALLGLAPLPNDVGSAAHMAEVRLQLEQAALAAASPAPHAAPPSAPAAPPDPAPKQP